MSDLFNGIFDKQGWRLFLASFAISAIVVFFSSGTVFSFGIVSLYLVLCGLSLFGIFSNYDKLSFSTNKTFFLFHYFFFGLAPVFQFKKGITFFNASKLPNEVYLELGLCLIFVQIIYLICYVFLLNNKKYLNYIQLLDFNNFNYRYISYLLVSVFSAIVFFYLVSDKFLVALIKPHFGWQKMHTKLGLLGYTLLLVVRAIPLIVFLLYKLKVKTFFYKELLLLLVVFLVAFPTSLPRATMVSYYLPIALIYFPFFSKKKNYVLSFLVIFFLMFPLLNFFRSFDFDDVEMGVRLFETAHMDAFHNFAQLYNQNLITYGKQFLGSILFFVQESQWYNRPVGTGQMLAEINCYNNTNISMPLWGEGYANFGFLGILFFTFVIAILNSFLDLFYKINKNALGVIFFFFFLGYEFYLLRGDLYSSFKKLFSFLLAFIIVLIFINLVDFLIKKIKRLT